MRNKIGHCHVVYDGYDAGPCIKDHEHQRRSLDKSKSAGIIIVEKNIATDRQDAVLANDQNKSQFIELVSRHPQMNGQSVRKCTGDADTEIVACVIDLPGNKYTTEQHTHTNI